MFSQTAHVHDLVCAAVGKIYAAVGKDYARDSADIRTLFVLSNHAGAFHRAGLSVEVVDGATPGRDRYLGMLVE